MTRPGIRAPVGNPLADRHTPGANSALVPVGVRPFLALLTHADVLRALVDNNTLSDFASVYANGFRANALALQGELASSLDLMVKSRTGLAGEFLGSLVLSLRLGVHHHPRECRQNRRGKRSHRDAVECGAGIGRPLVVPPAHVRPTR